MEGLVTFVQIAFIACKVFGWTAIANWTWWWVLSPLIAGCTISVMMILLMGGIFLADTWNASRRQRAILREREAMNGDAMKETHRDDFNPKDWT